MNLRYAFTSHWHGTEEATSLPSQPSDRLPRPGCAAVDRLGRPAGRRSRPWPCQAGQAVATGTAGMGTPPPPVATRPESGTEMSRSFLRAGQGSLTLAHVALRGAGLGNPVPPVERDRVGGIVGEDVVRVPRLNMEHFVQSEPAKGRAGDGPRQTGSIQVQAGHRFRRPSRRRTAWSGDQSGNRNRAEGPGGGLKLRLDGLSAVQVKHDGVQG